MQACAGSNMDGTALGAKEGQDAPKPPTSLIKEIGLNEEEQPERMQGQLLGGMPRGGSEEKKGFIGLGSSHLSIGSPTSLPTSLSATQEQIEMSPILPNETSTPSAFGNITSTGQLVQGLSDPKAQEKEALLTLFKAYNVFFDKLGMAQTEPEYIYEYSALARITLPRLGSSPTLHQKEFRKKLKDHLKTYTEVWRRKVKEGFLIKQLTQGIVPFLKHIDVQAFGRDTTLLRKLGQSLLEQLPLSADAYTADQYPSHKDTLHAIEQALIKIRGISEDKLDPKEGLYRSFKERLDKIMTSKYYPVAYQARCIAQNLTRMEKAPSSWEKAGQAASRVYAGFKGLLQVTQGILGAVYFDLDLEEIETGIANIVSATLDTMEAMEEAEAKRADCIAKVLGATTYKTEPWYAHTQALLVSATACLLPEVSFNKAQQAEQKGFADCKDYADYQQQAFARYQQQAAALVSKTKKGQLAALQYGIVQHLTLVGMQSQSQEVRKACVAALSAKLKDTAWHAEAGVIEGVLVGLENMSIKYSNEASGQAAKAALAALAKAASALVQQQEQAAASSCFGCCSSAQRPASTSPAGVHLAWAQRRRSSVVPPLSTGRLFAQVKKHLTESKAATEKMEKELSAQKVLLEELSSDLRQGFEKGCTRYEQEKAALVRDHEARMKEQQEEAKLALQQNEAASEAALREQRQEMESKHEAAMEALASEHACALQAQQEKEKGLAAMNAELQRKLNKLHQGDDDVSEDHKEALAPRSQIATKQEHYRAAIEGDPMEQFKIGKAYQAGDGVTPDHKKAFAWYQKAAQGGYARAQCVLGLKYEYGLSVGKDYKKAMHWYQKAAEQSNALAQLCIGDMHEKGLGVPKDATEAQRWYARAFAQAQQDASKGDEDAQIALGYMYDGGQGVEQDDKEAVAWYRKAAKQEYARAQTNLGEMYDYGRGVEQDDGRAHD